MSFKNFNSQIKAEKAPKVAGKKPFSSRTVIGVVCIIMALAVTFGVAPLVNRFADQKVDIVRLKTDIERGSVISEQYMEGVLFEPLKDKKFMQAIKAIAERTV